MSKIVWDKTGDRFYEKGVSKGVLYPMSKTTPGTYEKGVPWNGLTNVSLNPTGGEPNPIYADNIKYLNLMSIEELEASIEAYTYPDEFAACDGSAEVIDGMFVGQQTRYPFALCYRTEIGSDTDPSVGFKIHIIYGALAKPSERASETINDSPEALAFSWDLTTTPVDVSGFKPSAYVCIDSTKLNPAKAANLTTLLDHLYGKDATTEPVVAATNPTLKFPDEIKAILNAAG